MNKPTAAIVLPLRFAWALLVSGADVIGAVLRQGLSVGTPPPASFVRIGFAPMSAPGAALLGCMISLTPGTTVLDIDMRRREMVLHMLDASDVTTAVAAIKHQFEAPLLAWFGEAP